MRSPTRSSTSADDLSHLDYLFEDDDAEIPSSHLPTPANTQSPETKAVPQQCDSDDEFVPEVQAPALRVPATPPTIVVQSPTPPRPAPVTHNEPIAPTNALSPLFTLGEVTESDMLAAVEDINNLANALAPSLVTPSISAADYEALNHLSTGIDEQAVDPANFINGGQINEAALHLPAEDFATVFTAASAHAATSEPPASVVGPEHTKYNFAGPVYFQPQQVDPAVALEPVNFSNTAAVANSYTATNHLSTNGLSGTIPGFNMGTLPGFNNFPQTYNTAVPAAPMGMFAATGFSDDFVWQAIAFYQRYHDPNTGLPRTNFNAFPPAPVSNFVPGTSTVPPNYGNHNMYPAPVQMYPAPTQMGYSPFVPANTPMAATLASSPPASTPFYSAAPTPMLPSSYHTAPSWPSSSSAHMSLAAPSLSGALGDGSSPFTGSSPAPINTHSTGPARDASVPLTSLSAAGPVRNSPNRRRSQAGPYDRPTAPPPTPAPPPPPPTPAPPAPPVAALPPPRTWRQRLPPIKPVVVSEDEKAELAVGLTPEELSDVLVRSRRNNRRKLAKQYRLAKEKKDIFVALPKEVKCSICARNDYPCLVERFGDQKANWGATIRRCEGCEFNSNDCSLRIRNEDGSVPLSQAYEALYPGHTVQIYADKVVGFAKSDVPTLPEPVVFPLIEHLVPA